MNTNTPVYKEIFNVQKGNFTTAGEASSKIKSTLKKLGISSLIIREVSIASYELELNLVIHSDGGALSLEMFEDSLQIIAKDIGPGIPDTALAMKEGYSTAPEDVRSLGFGAGMGLPNIKRHSQEFSLESEMGVGTTIVAKYFLNN